MCLVSWIFFVDSLLGELDSVVTMATAMEHFILGQLDFSVYSQRRVVNERLLQFQALLHKAHLQVTRIRYGAYTITGAQAVYLLEWGADLFWEVLFSGHPELSKFSTYEIASLYFLTPPPLLLFMRQSTFFSEPKNTMLDNTMRFSTYFPGGSLMLTPLCFYSREHWTYGPTYNA